MVKEWTFCLGAIGQLPGRVRCPLLDTEKVFPGHRICLSNLELVYLSHVHGTVLAGFQLLHSLSLACLSQRIAARYCLNQSTNQVPSTKRGTSHKMPLQTIYNADSLDSYKHGNQKPHLIEGSLAVNPSHLIS